ncbi:MAG: hypothetical protein ACK5RC_12925, partial [Curvibacter sp.]
APGQVCENDGGLDTHARTWLISFPLQFMASLGAWIRAGIALTALGQAPSSRGTHDLHRGQTAVPGGSTPGSALPDSLRFA